MHRYLNQASAFLSRSPVAAVGTMAAAIALPYFSSSEDRGYFRTALFTTPLVFAGAMFIPNVAGSARDIANRMVRSKNVFRSTGKIVDFSSINFHDLGGFLNNPDATEDVIQQALSGYLNSPAIKKSFTADPRKLLNKYFYRNFVIPQGIRVDAAGDANLTAKLSAMAHIEKIEGLHATKSRLISNALHAARRSSLTPAEWANENAESLKQLSNDEMIAVFEEYQGRDTFVKGLSNRLRRVKKLNDTNISIAANDHLIPISTKSAMLDATDAYYPVEKAFMKQRPDVMKRLQSALGKGLIDKAEITAESVASGDIGRILNVKVFRRGNIKPLEIPIMDLETGSVKFTNAVGVGNSVIGPDLKPYWIDEFIAKTLLENPSDFSNEMLEKEITSHAYYLSGDPLDSHRMAELAAVAGEGDDVLSARAIKTRSWSASMTGLPFWKDEHGVKVTASQLDPQRQIALLRETMNTGRFTKIGSESGIFRLQRREASNISPYGVNSAEKQDWIWRSITKDLKLKSSGNLPSDANIHWRSTAWEGLTGSSELPGLNLTVGSISPQDRMFFADLPSTQQEFEGSFGNIMESLEKKGMNRASAIATFEDLRDIYTKGGQGQLKSFGRMGETGFLMKEGFANELSVEGVTKYRVDTLTRNTATGVGVDDVLGFTGAEAVTPKFPGVIDQIYADEKGRGFYLDIIHKHAMQGAKVDVAGVKGMVAETVPDVGFEQMRQLVNTFNERTGAGAFLPETVNTFAPMEYFANKVDPAAAYLGISADVLNRIEGVGAGNAADDYLVKMEAEGINFVSGQIVIDATRNPQKDAEAAERLLRLADINEEFFAKAGDSIKAAGSYAHDPVLSGYVKSGQSLGDYYLRSNLPAATFAWNHSMVNVPKFASFTHDIETYLTASGNFRSLKALHDRVVTNTGGDANKAIDFLGYIMKGDFSKELGATIPLGQAFNSIGSLTEPANRAGSIFDPSIDKYKESFRLDLGPNAKNRYLPVPGTNVYGAEASMYGEGKYAAHDYQKKIHDIFKAGTSAERDTLAQEAIDIYKMDFGTGKQSAFRPSRYDPLGAPGFLSISAEKTEPFVARVSPDWVAKLRSKDMREAFNPRGKGVPGEGLYGMLLRQPTQESLHLKYVMDPKLKGTMDVAVDEAIARMHAGDQDQDLVSNLLWERGSDAEKEAIEAIASGRQSAMAQTWASYKGEGAEIARDVNANLKDLRGRTTSFAEKAANRTQTAINRTASETIGAFSNSVTSMMEQATRNPTMLRDPDLMQRFKVMLSDVKQASISARKTAGFDLETAQRLAAKLQLGINTADNESAIKTVHEVFSTIAGTLTAGKKEGPEYAHIMGQGRSDIEAWALGRSSSGGENARLMARVLVTNKPKTQGALKTASRNLQQAFENIEAVRGAAHGGRMATVEAAKLGKMSEFLSTLGREGESATGAIGEIIAKHGKALAIGAGALAALGVVLSPRTASSASFNRASSNAYRPENQMGIADHIPGEAMEGQMAPSNRPRRVSAATPNVRTTIVAPLSRTSDLSVKTKSTDMGRIADTIRQVSQIPGSGNTNVTVNYKDRTKLGSLRLHDRIREILR